MYPTLLNYFQNIDSESINFEKHELGINFDLYYVYSTFPGQLEHGNSRGVELYDEDDDFYMSIPIFKSSIPNKVKSLEDYIMDEKEYLLDFLKLNFSYYQSEIVDFYSQKSALNDEYGFDIDGYFESFDYFYDLMDDFLDYYIGFFHLNYHLIKLNQEFKRDKKYFKKVPNLVDFYDNFQKYSNIVLNYLGLFLTDLNEAVQISSGYRQIGLFENPFNVNLLRLNEKLESDLERIIKYDETK